MVRGANGLSNKKDTNRSDWNQYEAILDNVHFDWDDHMHEGQEQSKERCLDALKIMFSKFTLREFNLVDEHATWDKSLSSDSGSST
jgi:hypothetical protein